MELDIHASRPSAATHRPTAHSPPPSRSQVHYSPDSPSSSASVSSESTSPSNSLENHKSAGGNDVAEEEILASPRLAKDSSQASFSESNLSESGSSTEPHGGVNEQIREDSPNSEVDEEGYQMRHGWDSQYTTEQLEALETKFYMYYNEKRHETNGRPKPELQTLVSDNWRMRDRLKTVSALLALCLNIGVDPPDVFRTNPCARQECWIDPTTTPVPSGSSAISTIGRALNNQYEQLSMRTRYKQLLDPTIEDTKKYCSTFRKNAKEERLLFHYNGHGVPKPTVSGEIWVFNKDYTQYIPIPLSDLQSWIGAPSLFVYDCSEAGLIIKNFNKLIEKYEIESAGLKPSEKEYPYRSFSDCIHLAACKENEALPTNPQLPADLFTSCLTTPIEIAVRFFMLRNPLSSTLNVDDVKIPGRSQERRTPLGELNWIFTAITDTIAWNSLPRLLFKRLFRQDLMVAALFRNFLLAQRVMRKYNCHPQSYPEIPDTHDNPLWDSWDLAIEMVLSQLPNLKLADEKKIDYQYIHSNFFAEQLTAFEVYLDHGAKEQQEPEQLPVVLQVLLSQSHRLRALVLLSRFLDFGVWAVELALSIGIFPYVLKLLQSQAIELKPPLVFIWARILAVDQSCQADLLKDNGYQYFVSILHPGTGIPVRDVSEHRAMCAFIIAMFCRDFRHGQIVAHSAELVESCLSHVQVAETEHPLLRQWSCLCLSMLWDNFPDAKWSGIRSYAHEKLCGLILDPVPEVRAAMLFAFTTFLGTEEVTEEGFEIDMLTAMKLLPLVEDGSAIVRRELTVFFSAFVLRYRDHFTYAALDCMRHELQRLLLDLESSEREDFIRKLGSVEGDHAPGLLRNESSLSRTAFDFSRHSSSLNHSGKHSDHSYSSSWDSTSAHGLSRVGSSIKRADTVSSVHDKEGNNRTDSFEDNDSVRHGEGQSHSKALPAFLMIWKHVLLLSADPDSAIANGASTIVSCVTDWMLERYGTRAENITQSVADLSELVQASVHDGLEENNADAVSLQASPSSARLGQDELLHEAFARPASRASSTKSLQLGVNSGTRAQASLSGPSSSLLRQASQPQGKSDAASVKKGGTVSFGKHLPSTPNLETRPSTSQFEETPSLPLQSDFFAWSMEFFKEPQMSVTEAEQPGSLDFNQRLWRRNRNEKILERTQKLKQHAGSSRWDHQIGYFDNGRQPSNMCFHQYDNHVVIADDQDTVRVWDWNTQRSLNKFSNGNPPNTRVTGTRFINEDDQALLMTGSSDGVLRVFSNYDSFEDVHTVTSFRGCSDMGHVNVEAGMVFDWIQGRGNIIVSGDSKEIQLWNAQTETCYYDIPTGTTSAVTSLTSDQVEGNVFAASFSNGVIRIYDQRLDPANAYVRGWKEHRQWITNLHLQRGGQRELVSGSRSGEVKLWDIRHNKSCLTVSATKDRMRSLSVHEHAPVFATGSERHNIKVFNMKGSFLSSFEPLNSFLHQNRSAPISTTSFHPHRMILACASLYDNHVTLYSCTDRRRQDP